MIPRLMQPKLQELATKFPVVTIVGPRQSGKSTLVRMAFPEYRYVSLENPSTRQFANDDPTGFFATYGAKTIIDEIQRVPQLFNYLQSEADKTDEPGQYILTGSQNFLLMSSVTQSLAGRTALLTLYPLSQRELIQANLLPGTLNEWLLQGAYPRVYKSTISPTDYYPAYIQTYLERDVRSEGNIGSLDTFQRFMRLCAGRIGSILDIGNISSEAGIDRRTAERWISVLEASSVVYLLRPFVKNFNKRLVKRPKLYFTDTGLACSLLGLQSVIDVELSAFRGGLFENLVLMEYLKRQQAIGIRPNAWFWHETSTNEVDFIFGSEAAPQAVEAKSGATFKREWFNPMKVFSNLAELEPDARSIVYGGDEALTTSHGTAIPWREW